MSIEPRWIRIDPTGLDARQLAHVLAKLWTNKMLPRETMGSLGWTDSQVHEYLHPSPQSVGEKVAAGWYDRDIPPRPSSRALGHDINLEEKQARRREAIRLREEEFKRDALAEVGLADHPKAEAIFDKAWNDCHGEGYLAVHQELRELAELFA